MRDYTQAREIEVVLSEITDQVATRLRHHQVQGDVVSVGIGYADAEEAGTSGFGAQMKVDPTNRTDVFSSIVNGTDTPLEMFQFALIASVKQVQCNLVYLNQQRWKKQTFC